MIKIKYFLLLGIFIKIIWANRENVNTGKHDAADSMTPAKVQMIVDAWKNISDPQTLHAKLEELLWKNYQLHNQLKLTDGESESPQSRNQRENFAKKSHALQSAILAIDENEEYLLSMVPGRKPFDEMLDEILTLLKTEGRERILDIDSPSIVSRSARTEARNRYVKWRYGLRNAIKEDGLTGQFLREMSNANLTEHQLCLGIANLFVNVQAWPANIRLLSPAKPSTIGSTLDAITEHGLLPMFADEPDIIKSVCVVLRAEKLQLQEDYARAEGRMNQINAAFRGPADGE